MFSRVRLLFSHQNTINQDQLLQSLTFKHTLLLFAFGSLLGLGACTQEQAVQEGSVAAPIEQDSTAITSDTATKKAVAEPVILKDTSWQYPGPRPLEGAILPNKRILAYYGNPLSKRMGILGEYPVDDMLEKLDEEVARWEAADSSLPVQPALHAIVVTAQGSPGRGGKYRLRMTNKMIDDVLEMAKKRDAIVFLDIQVGQSTLQQEIPQLEAYLKLPHVHLGIDAEFAMQEGQVPGKKIGSFDDKDINYATTYLADLVKAHQLPPKLLIVHRFTQGMIKNTAAIELKPEVQVVMHMDGWGQPALKKDTYRRYIQKEPVQFTGFKIFYKNDTKNGSRLLTPEEVLALTPTPLYIQYQ